MGQGLDLESKGIPFIGNSSAPVYLTLFADLKCPYSMRIIWALRQFTDRLEEEGKGSKLKWLYRHYVRGGYPQSQNAAYALTAAHRQGDEAFRQILWPLFFAENLTSDRVLTCAAEAGLDLERFQADLSDKEVKEIIQRDQGLAMEIGFAGTPGVVLCGVQVEPDPDAIIKNLKHLIDE